jgi:hypothetical protein
MHRRDRVVVGMVGMASVVLLLVCAVVVRSQAIFAQPPKM